MSAPADCRWTAHLLRQGYCIIPDAVPAATVEALNADLDPVFAATPFGQGRFYGSRSKPFGSLLKRSRPAEALVMAPTLFCSVETVLRSGEHTSDLQSLMRISYAVFFLKKQ